MLDKLVAVGIYILISSLVLTIFNKLFDSIIKRNENIHLRFLKSLLNVIFILILGYALLSQFESTKDFSKTIMQSGTLLIALVTFAAQQVLSNVISGIVISFVKPFNIGDKITLLNGSTSIITGIVMDLNTRHVSIKTSDGKVALIANSLVDSYVCINENTLDNNGYPFAIECSYDSNIDLAIELMQKEIYKHPLTLANSLEDVNVTCSRLTPNGFELKSVIFTEDISSNFKACSDLRISVFKVWKENGIELPYQTITISGGSYNE